MRDTRKILHEILNESQEPLFEDSPGWKTRRYLIESDDIDKKQVGDEEDREGYIYRKEVWSTDYPGNTPDLEMESGYSKIDGSYIGAVKEAERLWKKYGIVAQAAKRENSVSSIGYSEKNKKWYGWSHRAIFGFKVGDTVKEGDVTDEYLPLGFKAKDEAGAKKMAIAFARSVS